MSPIDPGTMVDINNSLLTLREAAVALRISKAKLYLERKAGRIRTVQIGRAARIAPADLTIYINLLRRGSQAGRQQ